MFPFNFLRIVLARLVLIRIDMSHVRTPVIGIEARDSKWLQQCFELQKHLILATPKDISQHLATPVINRMPQPPLVFFGSLDERSISGARTGKLGPDIPLCERRLWESF
jgi:hypothetical protein